MEKKKLTKEQREKREVALHKMLKTTCIVSLALNLLFIILAIVGCAGSNSQKSNEPQTSDIAKVLRNERKTNNAINDSFVNSNCVGFDLSLPKDTNTYGDMISNYSTAIFNNVSDFIFWSNSGPLHTTNNVVININVHRTFVNFDSIEIRCLNLSHENVFRRFYQYSDGQWYSNSEDSEYSTDIGFCLVVNNQLENYSTIIEYFTGLFNPVKHYDYQLAENWNVSTLYGSDFYHPTTTTSPRLVTITDNICFSVGGKIYTAIKAFFTGSNIKVYDNSEVQNVTSSEIIQYVSFYNQFTQHELIVQSVNTTYVNIDGTANLCYVPNSLHWLNSQYKQIRLFDYNLEVSTSVSQTTNYNLFFMNSIGYVDSNGEVGNVFGLFGTAFSGLSGLFSIKLSEGITIGMLLFLPLVAIIVFAIIKVVKK